MAFAGSVVACMLLSAPFVCTLSGYRTLGDFLQTLLFSAPSWSLAEPGI